MDGVPRTIGLPPQLVTPHGLGTCPVESLTGYAARMRARIAVPTLAFVRRAFQDAQRGDAPPLRSTLVAAARRLNVDDCGSGVAVAMGRLTGHSDLDRLSWYAREGARLVHAGEVVALTGSNESESLRLGCRRLAELAEHRGLLAVQRFFSHDVFRARGSKIEALMSTLWRLDVSLVELFSAAGTRHDSRPAKPLNSFSWMSATPPNAPRPRRTQPTVQ